MISGIIMAVIGIGIIGASIMLLKSDTYKIVGIAVGILLLLGGVTIGLVSYRKQQAANKTEEAEAEVARSNADPGTYERKVAASEAAYSKCYQEKYNSYPRLALRKAKKADAACAYLKQM